MSMLEEAAHATEFQSQSLKVQSLLYAREQAASQAGGPTIDLVSPHERTTLPTPSTVAIIAAAAPIWDRGGSRPPWIRELATTPPAPIMRRKGECVK